MADLEEFNEFAHSPKRTLEDGNATSNESSRFENPELERGPISPELKSILDKLIDSNGNLDMRNVTTLIWCNRDNKSLVQTITEQLIANSNERTVFNGVEFYLPQLAHMIIHLDADITSSALEQFSLVVCQQSLHVALQLNWILVAALEDYQPELQDGNKNPKANTTYFRRCIELLQNVERIVALGSPSDGLFLGGPNTQWELIKLKLDRANTVITNSSMHSNGQKMLSPRGYLWHKQWVHKKGIHGHRWIRRWFSLEDRVLYCYREPVAKKASTCFGMCSKRTVLKRAIVLHHATVEYNPDKYKDGKYEFYFTITSPMGNWRLRAESEMKLNVWVQALQMATAAPPVLISQNKGSFENDISIASPYSDRKEPLFVKMESQKFKQLQDSLKNEQKGNLELNLSQFARYQFFNSEREFVRSLTDICEELRFVPNREDRGPLLKQRLEEVIIPPVAYLPLVQSTDLFRKILHIASNESRPFSTKERCPALITFETAVQWLEDSDNDSPLDVANFLHWTYVFPGRRETQNRNNSTFALYGSQVVDPEELILSKNQQDGNNSLGDDRRPTINGLFGSPQRRDIWRKEKATVFKHPIGLFSPFGVRSFRPPSFSLPSLQVKRRLTKRWGSKDVRASTNTGGIGLDSPTNNTRTVNAWPDVERADNDNPYDGEDELNRASMWPQTRSIESQGNRNNGDSCAATSLSVECVPQYGSVGNIVVSNTGSNTPVENLSENAYVCSSEEQDIRSRAALLICQGESLQHKVERLRQVSSYSSFRGWGIERVICKSNDDLRQEVFIMQLIYFYLEVFQKENLELWLQPYSILSTSKSTGLIQVLDDSSSIHGVKKGADYPGSLIGAFQLIFGPPGSENLEKAQRRFAQSLAGYSVVSYLLAFKDRHNGNIMLTTEGRLIHIDFGFVFGQAPGGKFSMERAPFKLTQEYADVLGGKDSELFQYYIDLVGKGLLAARKYATVSITLLEIMMFRSEFPCFSNDKNAQIALREFKQRLLLNLSDDQVKLRARNMVNKSLDHWGTVLYDKFQLYSNGILP